MNEALLRLAETAEALFATGFAVFLRVGAALALMPAFGEHSVPMRVRLALALAFTAVCAPVVAAHLPEFDGAALIGRILASEVIVGLALGAMLRLFILALQIAGSMAAQSVSLSQMFGTQGADPQPAIGHILTVGGLALAVMSGLHVKFTALLIYSYELFPPGVLPNPADFLEWGIDRVAKAFTLGFGLAAPLVITALLYNLALGAINRAMPQLMVAMVGAPAITAGGLILLALSMPYGLQVWMAAFDAFLVDPVGAAR